MSTFATPHSEIAHERVEDEVIVINLRTGAYFSLVGAAADAWDLLLGGATPDRIAEVIGRRYGVDEQRVRADLDPFVTSLVDEGLLATSDRSPSPADEGLAPAEDGAAYKAPKLEKYDDMEELLLLDPIHEVDEAGWPVVAAEPVEG